MQAKSTSLVKGPGRPFVEPRQLDSSVHFSLHLTLHSTCLSSSLLPTCPILPVFAPCCTDLSSLTLTLLWIPPSRDHSSFHSTLIHFLHPSPLHSAMHSPLHSPVYTPPSTAFPPHSPPLSTALSPHTCPFHSISFHNGAGSVVPAFSGESHCPVPTTGSHATKTRPDTSMAN